MGMCIEKDNSRYEVRKGRHLQRQVSKANGRGEVAASPDGQAPRPAESRVSLILPESFEIS